MKTIEVTLYKVTMEYDEPWSVNGINITEYGVTFDAYGELLNFLNGKVAYDEVDDSYLMNDTMWGHKAHLKSIETATREKTVLEEEDWRKLEEMFSLDGMDEDDLLNIYDDYSLEELIDFLSEE